MSFRFFCNVNNLPVLDCKNYMIIVYLIKFKVYQHKITEQVNNNKLFKLFTSTDFVLLYTVLRIRIFVQSTHVTFFWTAHHPPHPHIKQYTLYDSTPYQPLTRCPPLIKTEPGSWSDRYNVIT